MANKRIIKVLILLSVMFLSLICYLTYIEIFQRDELVSNSYNQRQWDSELGTQRGNILDSKGVILAETQDTVRVYPYKGMYSHIIGYNSRTYGRINLERTYNDELLGRNTLSNLIGTSVNEYGYDLMLTIDHSIQSYAYQALGNNNGSVIAINPKTGGIIAMVSKPDFDPNDEKLIEKWNDLVDDANSPFLPRATSGLYAPGSTFKLLTALLAVENKLGDMTFEDEGTVEIGGNTFENQKEKAYGTIDLSRGFAVSSNVVFCTLGAKLGGDKLADVAERFGFNKKFDFDIPYQQSSFPLDITDDAKEASLAIGQGDILATPLQMAMLTCGIANEGVIMKPHLVGSVLNIEGEVIVETKPSKLYTAANAVYTDDVVAMMVETVKNGTGSNASIWGIDVAGKTGTAENEKTVLSDEDEHTWFVGFAPAYDPEIAVVVMMEYSGGTGGGNCAPIARNIMQKYLNK